MQKSHALHATGLTKRYGRFTAVDDVSLSVAEGEFFGFLGPNGAGKSTTIRMLAGLLTPTSGTISVAGCDVAAEPLEVKQRIGLVSEDTALYERLSAAEFLEFAGQMHSLSRRESRDRAADLLEMLDLASAANTLIADYSMGMKKKTAIAAALIHRPRVLFLDEPLNGVDTLSARVLCDVFQYLVRERGVTVFFTSHVLEMVERLCDRVAIIASGKIIAEGTPNDICCSSSQPNLELAFAHLVGAPSETRIPAWL